MIQKWLLLLISLLCFSSVFAKQNRVNQIYTSPDNGMAITESCVENKESSVRLSCHYSYQIKEKKPVSLIDDFPGQGTISWLGNIAKIHFNCGSYCNNTVFVDAYKGEDSENTVMDVDSKSLCMAYLSDNNGISFRKLFQKQIRKTISPNDKKFRFMMSFSILAIIQESQFDTRGNYIITYMNQEEEEQTKTIKNPCGQ